MKLSLIKSSVLIGAVLAAGVSTSALAGPFHGFRTNAQRSADLMATVFSRVNYGDYSNFPGIIIGGSCRTCE
jgi:hypothetical protein